MSNTDILKRLVQKAEAGDRTAFEELYRETCRFVYFTCLGLLKDEQEAQDITQEVYLTAFEQMGTLEDAGKFRPWLYRIAANKSINCLKKKQPIPVGDEQLQEMETEENENFLPEEYALNADKREMVLKIVRETCSDVLYQTILLHYFNEFSIAEIAEIMDCPEGTVKYRLSVARAKIRDGVLRHEKKSGERLYVVAPISFLTLLFTEQIQDTQMLLLPLSFKRAFPGPTPVVKAGRRIVLKSLHFKIAAGIAAAIVAVGGIAATAVIITTHRTEEVSAKMQEESTPNITDAGNTGDAETLQETVTSEMSEQEALSVESETTVDMTIKENKTEEKSEPTAEPEPQYTYTDMSAAMYATQTVNVRNLPNTDGEKVGSLSTNEEIAVTGQCNETGWYRFEYNGVTSYVSNNYVSDTQVEVSAPAELASSGGSSSNNAGKEPCPYPLNVWIPETTEYGLKIYVIYTTKTTIRAILYDEPLAENHYLTDSYNEIGQSILWDEMSQQQDYLCESTGVFHGFHMTHPFEKVGTYAEGTIYKCSYGGHYYTTYDPELGHVKCPNPRTENCPAGSIN